MERANCLLCNVSDFCCYIWTNWTKDRNYGNNCGYFFHWSIRCYWWTFAFDRRLPGCDKDIRFDRAKGMGSTCGNDKKCVAWFALGLFGVYFQCKRDDGKKIRRKEKDDDYKKMNDEKK